MLDIRGQKYAKKAFIIHFTVVFLISFLRAMPQMYSLIHHKVLVNRILRFIKLFPVALLGQKEKEVSVKINRAAIGGSQPPRSGGPQLASRRSASSAPSAGCVPIIILNFSF